MVLLSLAVFASLRSPVPGVNEPHYLTKAKHFWDAAWCSRDPFLQSANAHYVFYATIGVLTRYFSLEQAAWIGRVLGWLLLSSGWTALASRLLPFRWGALWSAWVFLAFAALGNWSGEWVVGGIEAKVLSYGCGWWSLASALSGHPIRAAAWSGAAVSFHPVVGIWNTVAVAGALFVHDWRIWRVVRQTDWKELVCCGLVWLLLAAPGLIPAVSMLRGANKAQSYAADYIQVFHRLAHHLDPWRFSTTGYWSYAALLGLSIVLYRIVPGRDRVCTQVASGTQDSRPAGRTVSASGPRTLRRDNLVGDVERWRLAARYVFAAVMIALGGVAIRAVPEVARWLRDSNVFPAARDGLEGWIQFKPHLAGLLKFYPFRLADVAVPWMASLLITFGLIRMCRGRTALADRAQESMEVGVDGSNTRRVPVISIQQTSHLGGGFPHPMHWIVWLVFGVCFIASLSLPAIDRNPSRLSAQQYADWVDACRWVERETPRDALCYAANDGWALKWFAARADFLSHKDCPQDAPGIIAWNERFKQISQWTDRQLESGFSHEELRELRRLTGIDYLITRKFGPIHLEPVYRNRNYRVYRLPG